MISLIELLEKEKWTVHEANEAYDLIAHYNEAADDYSAKFGDEFYQLCMDHLKQAQIDYDKATQEVREIRKQIKEHIAMIMAIE